MLLYSFIFLFFHGYVSASGTKINPNRLMCKRLGFVSRIDYRVIRISLVMPTFSILLLLSLPPVPRLVSLQISTQNT